MENEKNIKYLGEILKPLDFDKSFKERQEHIENLLCRSLNMKTVVAFIGAGASIPLGYPSWKKFAEDMLKLLEITLFKESGKDCIAEKMSKAKKAVSDTNFVKLLKEKVFVGVSDVNLKKYTDRLQELLKENYSNKSDVESDISEVSNRYHTKRDYFTRFNDYLGNESSKELDVQTIFSECERLLCSPEEWQVKIQSRFFRILVKSYFEFKNIIAKNEKFAKKGQNPYLALLDLPIKKFVTFNYDLEIEKALLFKNKIDSDVYKLDRTCKQIVDKSNNTDQKQSFSQDNENCSELANFYLSRNNDEGIVFHCHGRIDNTENCIVSEEDYQKWYLQEDKELFLPFRQALEITLDSSPILFIGFGLNDPDFMRILRNITANSTLDRTRNHMFCLLYVRKDDIGSGKKYRDEFELNDECTMLYIKYGLHVIPVYAANENSNNGGKHVSEPTCDKLIDLKKRRREWWNGIVQKPKFRKFENNDREQYFHYEFGGKVNRINDFDKRLHEDLDKALGFVRPNIEPATESNQIESNKNECNKDSECQNTCEDKKSKKKLKKPEILGDCFATNLAVVLGDGGTGKSWGVQSYLKKKRKLGNGKKYKIFFWSSYYANDVLTGIDRLVEFLVESGEIKDSKNDKFEWLIYILNNTEDVIIVFDGIEKLLKPNKENTEGESANPEVTKFFKIITNKNVKSKIIITTRLFPSDIFFNLDKLIESEKEDYTQRSVLGDIKTEIKKEKVLLAPNCWEEQLTNDASYLKVNGDYITTNFKGIKKDFYSYFCSLFNGHVFAISLMKGILESLVDKDAVITKSLVSKIVNTPVELQVNRVIGEAIANLDREGKDVNSKIYEKFIERISLFMHPISGEVAKVCLEQINDELIKNKVKGKEIEKINVRTVLENLCKKELVQVVRINTKPRYVVHPLIRSYVFETLHKSRFVSLPGLQLPGVTSGKEIVDPGNKRGQDVSQDLFKTLCEKAKNSKNDLAASDLCRASFSILRSRFSTNTVARWGTYTDYVKNLLLLFDTAKHVSKEHWDFNEPTKTGFENCSAENAPLYSDELAWVYNEIGITSFSIGDSLTAAAITGEGFEINRLIDKEFEGRYTFQSNVNKGAVNLHYGKLDVSMNYLKKAFEIANKLESKSLIGRARGYIALVKYLNGNLEEANKEFDQAYIELDDNPRAKSYFLTMHGELLLKLGRDEDAIEKIEQSRHIAESAYYPDFAYYAKLAMANYFVKKGEHIKAQNEFQQVLQFAKDKHLRRLETGTLSGMSTLAEKLGDYSTAISRAVESLKISNEYSLRLHQTLSMIVLGRALINGHQHRKLGIACLQTAKAMAKKQEYFLRFNEAEEELQKININ
jgi:tetratricopeptide (TPR) repeat protein